MPSQRSRNWEELLTWCSSDLIIVYVNMCGSFDWGFGTLRHVLEVLRHLQPGQALSESRGLGSALEFGCRSLQWWFHHVQPRRRHIVSL